MNYLLLEKASSLKRLQARARVETRVRQRRSPQRVKMNTPLAFCEAPKDAPLRLLTVRRVGLVCTHSALDGVVAWRKHTGGSSAVQGCRKSRGDRFARYRKCSNRSRRDVREVGIVEASVVVPWRGFGRSALNTRCAEPQRGLLSATEYTSDTIPSKGGGWRSVETRV